MARAHEWLPRALVGAVTAYKEGLKAKERTPEEQRILDRLEGGGPRVFPTAFRRLEKTNKREAKSLGIIYRQSGTEREQVLDGYARTGIEYVIEVRAPDADGGASCPACYAMADAVEAALAPYAIDMERYDEPDDESQQQDHYYAHILEVTLPPDGLPDAA